MPAQSVASVKTSVVAVDWVAAEGSVEPDAGGFELTPDRDDNIDWCHIDG